jgi:hypothetical protein
LCQKQQFEGVIVRGKCGKTTQSWGKSDTKRIQNEGILKHVLRAMRRIKLGDVKSRHNRRIISLSPLTNRHL